MRHVRGTGRAYVEQYAKRTTNPGSRPTRWSAAMPMPRWGKLQAAIITRADVRSHDGPHRGTGARQPSARRVSAVFTWAVKQEILAANPCKSVDRNPTKSRERVFSDSEVPQFWAAFDDAGLVASSALKLILLTGQRPGEVAHMRHEHIVDGWWQMPGEPSPSLDGPAPRTARATGCGCPRRRRHCWPSWPTRPQDSCSLGHAAAQSRSLDAAMRTICGKLKVERATPHDLRRTHGSAITALGFGRDAMNRIQNHNEGGIASVYDRHQYADENQARMEAVASKIMALVEGTPDRQGGADQALNFVA